MTDRITPQELAQMKRWTQSWTHNGDSEPSGVFRVEMARLIREVELLTEERERLLRDITTAIKGRIILAEERDKLRAALREIVQLGDAYSNGNSLIDPQHCSRVARAALGDK